MIRNDKDIIELLEKRIKESETNLVKIRVEILEEIVSHSGTGEEVIQAYVDGLKKGLDIIDKCRKKKWRDKYGRFRIMELVIKVSEGLKNDFKSEQWTALSCMEMKDALEKATPLPKGYGRLIDADAFIKTMEDASKRQNYKDLLIDNNLLTVDDVFNVVIESLQNEGLANGDTPTIIEADKGSENT